MYYNFSYTSDTASSTSLVCRIQDSWMMQCLPRVVYEDAVSSTPVVSTTIVSTTVL